ncbi:hypothetical protein T4A_6315 [Trichinella pseudospiralis]|uniref:Uncharacterized protein n=1 Tax=Trichinella pseudospiralis TaxID=6337 RepID=A0A0V1JZJ1_TRIPS|nr:hypothetical protein T4A_6315 [Trichinella pseudospiralis]KRZ40310.1 hypothetical protein T4C_7531 [Trichinella pseudospiralis]
MSKLVRTSLLVLSKRIESQNRCHRIPTSRSQRPLSVQFSLLFACFHDAVDDGGSSSAWLFYEGRAYMV